MSEDNQAFFRDLFSHFKSGPSDDACDKRFRKSIYALSKKDGDITADDLIDLLDRAVFGALCNDFILGLLNRCWRDLGGNDEQAERRRKDRGEAGT